MVGYIIGELNMCTKFILYMATCTVSAVLMWIAKIIILSTKIISFSFSQYTETQTSKCSRYLWPVACVHQNRSRLSYQICDFVVSYQLVKDTTQLRLVSLQKFQDHTRVVSLILKMRFCIIHIYTLSLLLIASTKFNDF